MTIAELGLFLEREMQDTRDLTLETRHLSSNFRGLDPIVLVALVGASGTCLGALVTSLLKVAQQGKTKKIVLQSKSGHRLEVPADTPPEKINEMIEKIKEMDEPSINIQIR